MTTYITKRFIQTLFVLFLVSIVVFSLLHFIPGDPVDIMLGETASEEERTLLRSELGLDRPLYVQYTRWIFHILKGDFGRSIFYHESVNTLVAARLPITIYYGLVAMMLAIIIGIPAGIISAVRRGGVLDGIITVMANIGMAMPSFWMGVLGIYFFALKLGWLPVQGYTSPFDNLWLNLKQILMPSVVLACLPLAALARQTRSSMLEVIAQDYIRTARSKGLKEMLVVTNHALKNALIPIVTLLGVHLRHLVGGSVLIETIFNLPGMGTLMVMAVFNKDYLVVQSTIMIIAVVIAMSNLVVDISYGYLDPRTRIEQE
ncbi:ABC transporter permease [Thermodesulfobacteriota bacterium]